MMDFDYYKDAATEKFGLVRTASLIEQARAEVKNSVLVDNGDVIQGSPLGDYMAAKGLKEGDVHPVYKAMNTLNYAVGNLGNHEFNYGLDFLHKALAGAKFPYVNANIIDAKTGKPMFTPYLIQNTRVVDSDGQSHTLRIGYIGFVPPQIMTWDKANLNGKVTVNDITETARKYIPEMRAKGADVVVVVAHSGLSADPYQAMAENSVYYLSQVPGVDAIMFGHAHAVFPGKDFANIKGADIAKGTLNGVPAVMPGMWGDHLGVVDLVLNNDSGKWQVTQSKAEARPIYDAVAKKSLAAEDAKLVAVLKAAHDATREFVSKPIGKSADNMYSYLALVQDDPTVQVVNMAQKAYVEHYIQGDPDLAKLQVLSAAAPSLMLFFLLRVLYGVAMGGIWGVASSLAMETIPDRSRGLMSGLFQAGYPFGYLLAAVAYGLLFEQLGWRGMFVIGAAPVLLLPFIYFCVEESPVWQAARQNKESTALLPVLRSHWKLCLYLVVLMAAFNFFSHGTQDLYPVFLKVQHGFEPKTVSIIAVCYNIASIIGGVFFGSLSEKIGRRKAIMIAALLALPVIPLWAFANGSRALGAGAFLLQLMVQGAWGGLPTWLN